MNPLRCLAKLYDFLKTNPEDDAPKKQEEGVREATDEAITAYLDETHLLKGPPGSSLIKPTHFQWFLTQATLLGQFKKSDPSIQQQLMLLLLHSFSKVAPVREEDSDHLGIQVSPMLPEDCRYHRGTGNLLLENLREAYARDMGVQYYEMDLIHSPLLAEAIARELPHPELNLDIESQSKYESIIDELLNQAKRQEFPEKAVLLDFSKLLEAEKVKPENVGLDIVLPFEDILMQKVADFIKSNPAIDPNMIANKLLAQIHLIAFTTHKNQHILLAPAFLCDPHPRFNREMNALISPSSVRNRHGQLDGILYHLISRHGYRLSPDQAKEAWLKVKDAQTILEELGLPQAKLATGGLEVPTVCKSFSKFVQMRTSLQFKALSNYKKGTPFRKVLPKATWLLLSGLAKHDVDKVFKEKGLQELLQISYFRMLNAMNEAILRRHDQIAFCNQIELIHQEIQSILAIVEPHDKDVFAESVIAKMTNQQGETPSIVPEDLGLPRVHLKPSAMHGLSSILASVEAEKGNNHLNVAVLKDCYYYQSDPTLKLSNTYHLSVLDGDLLKKRDIEEAFDHPPVEPIDLFVCEFHHNIMAEKQIYRPEDVLGQLKTMLDKGLMADKFTVVIDTTIDLEQSGDARNFLADEQIKTLILQGRLNVIFLRSAQKFDMFGMDNYYGGVTMTLNAATSFSHFNARMDLPEDQLQGISYQGLAHLHKYSGNSLEEYRQEIMKNTRRLYRKLPREAIYHKGTTNPMQISKIKDDRLFFLDIKFPDHPKTGQLFKDFLLNFAKAEKLPFTIRSSFGFINTNFTVIEGNKFRLSLGLDGKESLKSYTYFFKVFQDNLIKALEEAEAEKVDPLHLDAFLANHIACPILSDS